MAEKKWYSGSFIVDTKLKRRTHTATVRDLSNVPDRGIVHIADILAHVDLSERHLRRLWSMDPPQAPPPFKHKSPGGHNEWFAGDWKRWHVGVSQQEWERWRT